VPRGVIKYYNEEKGYGFIAQEDGGADVFMHNSSITGPYDQPRVGQKVRFTVKEGKKGLVGHDIELVLTALEKRWLSQGKNLIPRESVLNQRNVNTNMFQQWIDEEESVDPDRQRSDFGTLYIEKQIRYEVPMFFATYQQQLFSATILNFVRNPKDIESVFVLDIDNKRREFSKQQIKYYYKDEDAQMIDRLRESDPQIQAQPIAVPVGELEDIIPFDPKDLQEARQGGIPIKIVLREGEIFDGQIDWVSGAEMKLVLRNGAKIVACQAAIHDLDILMP
jgi:CspA family cold shock protein